MLADEIFLTVLINGKLKLISRNFNSFKLINFAKIKKEIWDNRKIIEYLKFNTNKKLIIKLKYAFLESVSKIKYETMKININKIDLLSLFFSILLKAMQNGSVRPNQIPV
tara:strand:- start:5 stop:334 length:330 start_codon:yes stop_codon:yes gene_type:complete